jgi:hypothetical protein
LKDVDISSTKELWAAVQTKRGPTIRTNLGSPDAANLYFSLNSFDGSIDYTQSVSQTIKEIKSSLLPTGYGSDSDSCTVWSIEIANYEIEQLLRSQKNTAPGLDNIPSWVFRKCSYELADVVAHIVKVSLSLGSVPDQWRVAVVTPIPKVPNAGDITFYRPISVTPILSRLVEKLIVAKFIRPLLPSTYISDQFAFRPTGSTTSALIFLMHQVTHMLESNRYVRCLMVDFSKAFDVIEHTFLLNKLKTIVDLPPTVINWIISFLTSRRQVTKINGLLSSECPINRGVVQGSGIAIFYYGL